jgi:hypothetical protein
MKPHLTVISLAMLFVLPSVFIYSCKSDKATANNKVKAVDQAFTTPVPFRDFEVDAEHGDTLSLTEGTRIFIPAGAFVDAAGAPVKGKVQLQYRAFYTPGDIIASGITMRYDTNNVTQLFTSAGMFEINGTQDGKAIEIAPEKTIGMDFASSRNDASYSFYRLDTSKANWEYISTTKADSNSLFKKIKKEIAELSFEKPVEPKSFNAKKPVIDIDVNLTDHPELSGYNGIVWQYAGAGPDPEKNEWIYSTEWTSAKLTLNDTQTCAYTLNLSNEKKSFATKVNPTFKGSDFTRALGNFKEKMQQFLSSEKIRKEKEVLLAKAPPFQRTFGISRWGIHNCDMFYRYGMPSDMDVEFHFDDPQFENNRQDVMVYVISANGGLSIAYNALNIQNVYYLPNNINCAIAVLRGTTKAAVINYSDFAKMINERNPGMHKIKMHSTTEEVSNAADIDRLLTIL